VSSLDGFDSLDWRHRAFPTANRSVPIAEVAAQGWNLLEGDLMFPVVLLKESALDANVEIMRRFCREHGADLAPHGKTTMSPEIIERQLAAGAWALTAASVHQARTFRKFGVDRVIVANEVVDAQALRWIADELAAHPEFECYSLADSREAVRFMDEALAGASVERPLEVLIEMGVPGGRTGARELGSALAVADAVAASPVLRLAGVEAFEGVIGAADIDESLAEVDRFVARLRELAEELGRRGYFDELDEVIVTAGGSAYFDRVVSGLAGLDAGRPTRLVLRSGCYVTHDSGHYEHLSPLGGRGGAERLRPAIEAWGVVLSRPEPGLAIIGFGKRDVPYDLDLPIPERVRRRDGRVEPLHGVSITALNDQHAFADTGEAELEVGDWIACGISHPCTAFDKWTALPIVNDDYTVVGVARTYF
jgi:D-serine deaminase-like pyridoxal phosphate-dependent protein